MRTNIQNSAATSMPRMVVSVLNWNAAQVTLSCIRSLLEADHCEHHLSVVVVDNGSHEEDYAALKAGLQSVDIRLVRLPRNIGFAAGHNVAIREAMTNEADFIWLLNNDTLVPPETLGRLLTFMTNEPACGAVSPVIHALHDADMMDFCGAWHDWNALSSIRPSRTSEACLLEATNPREMWLHGTAVLLRIAALRQSGLLDEAYFAYYEDDDIGVRLARAGWANRMCFDATIRHSRRVSILAERPAYYFYLMARNSLLFWGRHAQGTHRKRLRLRLVTRSLIEAAKLRGRGMKDKSDACLIGTVHGLTNKVGPPIFDSPPPLWISLASRFLPYRLLNYLT